jgi:putative hydrolase of the HAD superfamily
MIKTVIFDLGKVIIPFDFKRGIERMAPFCKYDAMTGIPERIRGKDLYARFESGQLEPDAFFREMSDLLEFSCGYEEFCDAWSAIFYPETLIPESMLEGLKRNYRLVLLSNTNAIHFDMVSERYPLLRHFDEYVLSYKVRAMKPSPRIFEAAIAAAQCAPEECFYTDDIAEYVEGARRLGMDAVQFESREQIERELRARGVNWG